jgi:hypothetical protein
MTFMTLARLMNRSNSLEVRSHLFLFSEVEAGDIKNTTKDDGEENYDALLATNGDGLTKDTKMLDVQFGNKDTEETIISNKELETAFKESNPEDNSEKLQSIPYPAKRFCSTTQNLNTLVMHTTIMRSEATEDPNAQEKRKWKNLAVNS